MMKASSKEDVKIHHYLDGKFLSTTVEKKRCIYKRKDGTEYITSFGDITRDAEGKPSLDRHARTVKALNILDLVKKVRETGGSIVVLSD
jgi:hypothetical protein